MMKLALTAGALGLALTLQACNQSDGEADAPAAEATATAPATEQASGAPAMGQMDSMGAGAAPAAPSAEVAAGPHSATGQVTTVTGENVSIDHQPIEALGWPAMNMTFQPADQKMLAGLEAGAPVQFTFRKEGEAYVITDIKRQ